MYEINYFLLMMIGLALPCQCNHHQKLQENTFFLSSCVYTFYVCVCAVTGVLSQDFLNVFKDKLLITGWSGKGSSMVVLYNAEHINGTH